MNPLKTDDTTTTKQGETTPYGYSMGYTLHCRDQSWYAPSQWEMSLHCNDVSHWLGSHLDWSLTLYAAIPNPLYVHNSSHDKETYDL